MIQEIILLWLGYFLTAKRLFRITLKLHGRSQLIVQTV